MTVSLRVNQRSWHASIDVYRDTRGVVPYAFDRDAGDWYAHVFLGRVCLGASYIIDRARRERLAREASAT